MLILGSFITLKMEGHIECSELWDRVFDALPSFLY